MLGQGFYNIMALVGIVASLVVIYKLVVAAIYYKRQEESLVKLAREIKKEKEEKDA